MSTSNPRISIGLHFSNTYCCTAAYDGTSAVTIPDGLGNKITPNCLVVHDDKTVVGDLAKKAPFVYRTFKGPLYTIESMLPQRRSISDWFDLENDDIINVEGELLTVEQVAKGIISYLKRCAERHTNTEVTQATVVVPQSFTQTERSMVQRASSDAGLTVQLLTEPAAASVAYYSKTQPASGTHWLVFSLAKHTLDLAVFSTTQNVQYTKAVESTDEIGGQDFDGCFINYCIQNFKRSSGIDLTEVQTDSFKKIRAIRAISKLRSNWESARSALARGRTIELSIDGFFNSEDLEVTISSAEWKSMAESNLEKCIGAIKTVLKRGGVDKSMIKDIIPVGNSPWNTLVLQAFAVYCGITATKSDLHPEEIAATGAAIQAYAENDKGSSQGNNVAEVSRDRKSITTESKKIPQPTKMVRVNFDHSYTHNRIQGRITKGEILHLIEKAEPKWWKCRRDGEAKAFLAPAVFLSLLDTNSTQCEPNLTSLLHNPRDSMRKRMAPQTPQQQPVRTVDNRPLSHAIGIDIGSTYCCIAIFKNDHVVVIPNELGQKTTPSYVTFNEDDDIVVGEASKSAAFKNYSTTVHSAKRLLGRSLQDSFIQRHKNKWPFKVIAGGETDVKIQLDGKILAPEDVTRELVRCLKENAQTYLGVDDLQAVVTVPVHFTERQRKLTQQACQAAGLNVLQLMTEPAAAAVAYHQDRTNSLKERNCLIFDLGGSTFDVAVLKSKGNIISIRTIGGDATLGGEDFDNALVKLCMDEFQSVNGIESNFEKTEIFASNRMRKCMLRLKKECEKQKSYLTTAQSVRVGLACFLDEMDMDVEISRKTFEGLIAPYLDRSIKIMKGTLKESGISKGDIDDVLLVGGSTRIPLVEKMLKEFFGRDCILVSLNPDEVVAAGAAIQAASVKNPHEATVFVEQPDFISSIAH